MCIRDSFPKVDKLTDLGDGIYKWEMEKVGTAQVNIQTVYASRYVSSKSKGTVVWTPVPDVPTMPARRSRWRNPVSKAIAHPCEKPASTMRSAAMPRSC